VHEHSRPPERGFHSTSSTDLVLSLGMATRQSLSLLFTTPSASRDCMPAPETEAHQHGSRASWHDPPPAHQERCGRRNRFGAVAMVLPRCTNCPRLQPEPSRAPEVLPALAWGLPARPQWHSRRGARCVSCACHRRHPLLAERRAVYGPTAPGPGSHHLVGLQASRNTGRTRGAAAPRRHHRRPERGADPAHDHQPAAQQSHPPRRREHQLRRSGGQVRWGGCQRHYHASARRPHALDQRWRPRELVHASREWRHVRT
jgi:hypothetical protein